jgi:hypothetical protein
VDGGAEGAGAAEAAEAAEAAAAGCGSINGPFWPQAPKPSSNAAAMPHTAARPARAPRLRTTLVGCRCMRRF